MKSIWLSTLLALLLIQPVHAAETLTAINMNPDWEGINGWAWYIGYTGGDYTNEAAGQEFVASVSGTLTTLEASVDRSAGGAPLVITFFKAVNGLPATSLGSVSVPSDQVYNWASEIPTPINTFDVSSANVTVEAGQHYFVSFTTPVAGQVRYRAILTTNNANSFGYRALYSKDGGQTWVYPNITPEIGMRLYVEPPPPIEYDVEIDIQPGDPDNQIQLGKKRPKPVDVVLFGSDVVAVEDVLVESLALGDPTIRGGQPTAPFDYLIVDEDGDGRDDLFLSFDLGDMEANGSVDAQSTLLALDGLLSTGDFVFGVDVISISQPGHKGKGNGKNAR